MTLRLTSSSLAGTLRKLVAVGTVRLRAMLAAIVAPTPRIGVPGSSVTLAGSPGCPVATGVVGAPGACAGRGAAVVDAAGAPLTVAVGPFVAGAVTTGDGAAASAEAGGAVCSRSWGDGAEACAARA